MRLVGGDGGRDWLDWFSTLGAPLLAVVAALAGVWLANKNQRDVFFAGERRTVYAEYMAAVQAVADYRSMKAGWTTVESSPDEDPEVEEQEMHRLVAEVRLKRASVVLIGSRAFVRRLNELEEMHLRPDPEKSRDEQIQLGGLALQEFREAIEAEMRRELDLDT